MATNNSVNEPTAASGKVLQGQGVGTASAFSTATYPATATGTNKVLVADGTNWVASTPTFPNASATSRKIIVSDGTNWVASTETWATPSTSGNVLTSDGTNWTSAAAAGPLSLSSYNKVLTSAQVKALHGTPIQVIAAPGAGKMLVIIRNICKLTYGGTNVFVAAAGQTINLRYGSSGTIYASGSANPFIVDGQNAYDIQTATLFNDVAATSFENQALNAYNPIATEITGNAANNNTITLTGLYYVISI